MEKTVVIDNKKYQLIFKGKTARLYRDYFQEDVLSKLLDMQFTMVTASTEVKKQMPNADKTLSGLIISKAIDNAFVERFMWTCMKTSNKNKRLLDYEKFIDNLDDYGGFISEGIDWLTEVILSMTPVAENEEDPSSEEKEDIKKLN